MQYVTYENMFLFSSVIIGIIGLCFTIIERNKK